MTYHLKSLNHMVVHDYCFNYSYAILGVTFTASGCQLKKINFADH